MKVPHAHLEIPVVKVGGKIIEVEKGKWFIIDRRYKSRESEELKQVKPRVQKIENGEYKYFKPVGRNAYVNLTYLNLESAKGLYKNPEDNLPYEVISQYGELVYRQSICEKKEEIFNRLEKLAVEEGLRN
jgi:hypothetical protein